MREAISPPNYTQKKKNNRSGKPNPKNIIQYGA
jgi:hypothetical protein